MRLYQDRLGETHRGETLGKALGEVIAKSERLRDQFLNAPADIGFDHIAEIMSDLASIIRYDKAYFGYTGPHRSAIPERVYSELGRLGTEVYEAAGTDLSNIN